MDDATVEAAERETQMNHRALTSDDHFKEHYGVSNTTLARGPHRFTAPKPLFPWEKNNDEPKDLDVQASPAKATAGNVGNAGGASASSGAAPSPSPNKTDVEDVRSIRNTAFQEQTAWFSKFEVAYDVVLQEAEVQLSRSDANLGVEDLRSTLEERMTLLSIVLNKKAALSAGSDPVAQPLEAQPGPEQSTIDQLEKEWLKTAMQKISFC